MLVSLGFIKNCFFLSPEISEHFCNLNFFLSLHLRYLVKVRMVLLLDLVYLSAKLCLSTIFLLKSALQFPVVIDQFFNLGILLGDDLL